MARSVIPVYEPVPLMQLSHLSAEFLVAHNILSGRSPCTIESYALTHKQFVGYLTMKRRLTDDTRHLTAEHVQGFVTYLVEECRAKPATIRTKLSGLSMLAEYGMRPQGGRSKPVVTENGAKSFRWPKLGRRPPRLLYDEELVAFLGAARPLAETRATLAILDTGLRITEFCSANVQDLMETQGRAFVRVSVKGGHEDLVPISHEVAVMIRDSLWERNSPGPREPLWVNAKGQRWKRMALGESMARRGRAVGITRIRVSPHKLRHTSSWLAKRGGVNDVWTRARMLSHGSLRSQLPYEHVLSAELSAAREQQHQALKDILGAAAERVLGQTCQNTGGAVVTTDEGHAANHV